MTFVKAGDRVVAYDYRIWEKRGRDLNNNEDCWKPATVIAVYPEPKTRWSSGGESMVDLKFDHLECVSKAHFLHAIRGRVSSDPRQTDER
jgi:hypothetical protein